MDLVKDFHQEMLLIYERGKEECDYRPTRFLEVVNEMGGLRAAKMFLSSDKPQEGLYRLWDLGRLDLSMEVLILKKKYINLFSDEEKKEAKKRLDDLGYKETREDK